MLRLSHSESCSVTYNNLVTVLLKAMLKGDAAHSTWPKVLGAAGNFVMPATVKDRMSSITTAYVRNRNTNFEDEAI